MMLGLVVFQQRAVKTFHRMKALYFIRKRKGESVIDGGWKKVQKCFTCCAQKKQVVKKERKQNVFDTMNKNVTSVMFPYLEAQDIGRLQQTSKRMNYLSDNR